MKKRISQLLFITMVTVALTGMKSNNCSVAAQEAKNETENSIVEIETAAGTEDGSTSKDGSWVTAEEKDISEEVLKVFGDAVGDLEGAAYDPVRLLATQTVSGMNYAFLCRVTPVYPDAQQEYSIVYVYADLEGKAEVTNIHDLTSSEEGVTGGWETIGKESTEISDAAIAALKKAAVKLERESFEPAEVLAVQVVAGMNYMLLCKSTPTGSDEDGKYCLVTIYENLEGEAEITSEEELIYASDRKYTAAFTGRVLEPLKVTMDISDISDATLDVGFAEGKDVYSDKEGKTKIRMDVYEKIRFDAVEIASLTVGDKIKIGEEEITVNTVKETKGGNSIDEEGIYTLVPADGGTYEVMGSSDHVSRIKVGEITLPVGEKFTILESSDLEKGAQTISKEEFIKKSFGSNVIYTPADTTVRVENGVIVELSHIYIP